MTHLLAYILWNPDLMAFHIGSYGVRWYGLCWLIGLGLAYYIVKWLYKDQKLKDELFDPLFLYCFFGVIVGARLGHCLFYEPDYFLSSVSISCRATPISPTIGSSVLPMAA